MSTNTTNTYENNIRKLAIDLNKCWGYGKKEIRSSIRRWEFNPDMDLVDRVLADMDIPDMCLIDRLLADMDTPETKPSFQNKYERKIYESKTRLEEVGQKFVID